MNWKSHGIDFFITETMACVKTANNDVLMTLKANLQKVEEILEFWAREPMMKRTNKPVVPDEFEAKHKVTKKHARYQEIAQGGKRIHSLLKESNRVLKVSQGLPDWKAYVDFVNNMVVDGLAQAVIVSLEFLEQQVGAEKTAGAVTEKVPMMDISLDLCGKDVMFIPDMFETTQKNGVRDIVNGWIESFFHVAGLFKRVDTNAGTYVKELQDNVQICGLLAAINEDLTCNEAACMQHEEQYKAYSFLWTTDLQARFQQVVDDATTGHTASGKAVLDLAIFDEAIARYRDTQREVNNLKTPSDIGWLHINSQPIKQALGTWVTKWVFMYTQHLQSSVKTRLAELRDFLEATDAGLDATVASGDGDALMKVMGHVRDVRKAMAETSEMFGPLQETVALLKAHGVSMDNVMIGEVGAMEYLEQAPIAWEGVVNRAFLKKKEEILPLQNAEVVNIKAQLEAFFLGMRSFRNDFCENAPFEHEGPVEEVYALLDAYEAKRAAKVEESARLNVLEELFELPVSKYAEPVETLREMKQLF